MLRCVGCTFQRYQSLRSEQSPQYTIYFHIANIHKEKYLTTSNVCLCMIEIANKSNYVKLLYYSYLFRSCNEKKGICSFPQAHVQLTKKQQLLMIGQPYKINLQLEMPESTANKELGKVSNCIL